MADDDLPPDDASDLLGALGDLGRRIDAAKSDADVRAQGPAPRRFPLAWIAVALLIALVSGGLVLASSDDDGDELAAGGTPTSDAVPSTTAPVDVATTRPDGDASVAVGGGTTTTPVPRTTAAPPTSAVSAAPTTTTAPSPTTTAAPPATTSTAPAPTEDEPPVAAGPAQTTAAPSEVTVAPGDSFWRIAEQQLGQQLGHPPSTGEITSYWAQLIELNADRLVQPGNPNLIYPGQVLVLPAPG